jgi:hypothetical protein
MLRGCIRPHRETECLPRTPQLPILELQSTETAADSIETTGDAMSVVVPRSVELVSPLSPDLLKRFSEASILHLDIRKLLSIVVPSLHTYFGSQC